MKYCKTTTTAHSLYSQFPDCVLLISEEVIKENGNGSVFINDEECIDMDQVERMQKRPAPIATMDMVIGISQKVHINNNGYIKEAIKSSQMLLVEFKFNCKAPANIKLQDIKDKIRGAKNLLGTETPVCKDYIFIFQTDKKSQAISHFSRLFSNRCPCKIMDIAEFKQLYF